MDANRVRASTNARVTPPSTLPTTGYLRLPQVLAIFPISRSAWWSGISKGIYPHGVRIGRRTTAWRVEEIKALIDKPL